MAKGFVCLLALLLLASRGFAQERTAVYMSAFPLSAFTKFPIDTTSIQVISDLRASLPRPAHFLRQLTRVLSHTDTVAYCLFKPDFVRFSFRLTYPNGRQTNAFISQGNYLLLDHRVYLLDNPVRKALRRYMPKKNEYLPLQSRRLQQLTKARKSSTAK